MRWAAGWDRIFLLKGKIMACLMLMNDRNCWCRRQKRQLLVAGPWVESTARPNTGSKSKGHRGGRLGGDAAGGCSGGDCAEVLFWLSLLILCYNYRSLWLRIWTGELSAGGWNRKMWKELSEKVENFTMLRFKAQVLHTDEVRLAFVFPEDSTYMSNNCALS